MIPAEKILKMQALPALRVDTGAAPAGLALRVV